VLQQCAGYGLGGGADVQHQRAIVGHACGHGPRDPGFALRVERFALRVADVLDGGTGHPHAPVKACEQPGIGHALDVPANGLQGHAQHVGQRLDRD
jgi:hypothetical protein